MLEMGKVEQSILKQAIKQGAPIPERIANAPELRLGLELYLQAFFDLDSERSHGMGLTRIAWSSIVDYSIALGLNEDETDDMIYFVKAMDFANLERLDSKRAK